MGNAAPQVGLPKQVDGSGQYGHSFVGGNFQKGLNTILEEDQASEFRRPEPKTLLQGNKSRNANGSVRLAKIGGPPMSNQSNSMSQLNPVHSTFSGSKANLGQLDSNEKVGSIASMPNTKDAQQSILNNLKSVKLSVDEQSFIKQYRKLEELEREKGIKFFQCVGDPPHSNMFVQSVETKRHNLLDAEA